MAPQAGWQAGIICWEEGAFRAQAAASLSRSVQTCNDGGTCAHLSCFPERAARLPFRVKPGQGALLGNRWASPERTTTGELCSILSAIERAKFPLGLLQSLKGGQGWVNLPVSIHQ